MKVFRNSLLYVFTLSLFAAMPLVGQNKPTAVTHDIEGKEACLMCHTAGVMAPVPDVPASHEARTDSSCLWCHAADSPMLDGDAVAISHTTDGRTNCVMCHAVGVMPPVPDVPSSHEGRGNDSCLWCHNPSG